MRIGILGSGLMGSKLGTILARAGHDVVFSYSRSWKKLQRLADDAGADAVLLAEIAYESAHGPKLTYRFEWPSERMR
jgi:predicted dinucleotide-binding enzyme